MLPNLPVTLLLERQSEKEEQKQVPFLLLNLKVVTLNENDRKYLLFTSIYLMTMTYFMHEGYSLT